MQKSKFGIRILSEDVFFAGKVEHALSRNPVWECIVKTGVEKEIDKYDDTVNVLILVYDFQHQTPETVLEKLKRNYRKQSFSVSFRRIVLSYCGIFCWIRKLSM